MLRVFAPAKVNLCLHVTGQRPDGYHLIDSLVVFADVGDWLTVEPSEVLSLTIDGPGATGLDTRDNLVLTAAQITEYTGAFHLKKNLPVSSGIGGGSADAAAAVRAMLMAGSWANPDDLLRLGADIPMCIASAPVRVQGIGEDLTYVAVPEIPAVLVNPRVPVSTPDVFRRLTERDNPGLGQIPHSDLVDWLHDQRNDLQQPAIEMCPVIANALDALSDARLARMSGSGATCFGVFDTMPDAVAAAEVIEAAHPDWWVVPTLLGDMSEKVRVRDV